MKKGLWQVPLLILCVFIFTVGLSYLALNEKQIHEDERQTLKMSIALVNEDEGAYFNDDKITFGDEFSNSVTKDNNHDWYVVSRG